MASSRAAAAAPARGPEGSRRGRRRPTDRARFDREADVLARAVVSGGVVQVYEAGTYRPTPRTGAGRGARAWTALAARSASRRPARL